MSEREILFECVQLGNVVRVTAVDAETGIEAIISMPANTSQPDMQRAAIRKLEYVMKKRDGR